MTFQVGDTIVHPGHGAGKVVEIKSLGFLGREEKRYYSIDLLSDPGTIVMVPVRDAEKVGLRPPIARAKIRQVWCVLRSNPETLPSDHKERYAVILDRLQGGEPLRIAEALRDMARRREEKRALTTEGKRLYDRAMKLLSAEIAVAQGSDPSTAESEISETLYVQ
jgi:CarD family transcriptional regulator